MVYGADSHPAGIRAALTFVMALCSRRSETFMLAASFAVGTLAIVASAIIFVVRRLDDLRAERVLAHRLQILRRSAL